MRNRPVLLAVSGAKDSGKTTLIEKLIPLLSGYGIKTAVIKHDGHSFTPDTPGTDSFRFFSAGAIASAVYDGEKYALSVRAPADERFIAGLFPDLDLILLEGFKDSSYPKLEVIRGAVSKMPVCRTGTCLALISDFDLDTEFPRFHIDAVDELADFIRGLVEEGA